MLSALTCDPRVAFQDLCTAVEQLRPTGILGPLLQHVVGPVLILIALVVLGRWTRHVADRTIVRTGGDPQVRELLHNVITVATYMLAVFGALTAGGLDITVLLTFGGLTSLAIGLAFQDFLRNVLSGIFLLVERPFRIGDLITADNNTGIVERIRLRTTTLRMLDGSYAILPNLAAFNGTVVNASANAKRHYTVSAKLPDGVDLDTALRDVRAALEGVSEVAAKPAYVVVPHLESDGSVSLRCSYSTLQTTRDPEAVAGEIARRAWNALHPKSG